MKKVALTRISLTWMLFTLAAGASCLATPGCGESEPAKKDNGFFTSGDREADQRADQRMAKEQQLKDSKAPGAAAAKPADNASLFDRLGGDKGITSIVDDYIPRVLADPRVNFDRKGVKQGGFSIHRGRSEEWNATPENIQKLKTHFVQFLALATGGPAKYDGQEMQAVHARLHISNAEFDAALGDLKASLDKLGVAVKEQKELLSVIESTRPQIALDR